MKPNLDLQKAILLFLAEKEGFSDYESITMDGVSDGDISYNIKLMHEENLVNAVKRIRTDTDSFERWEASSCTSLGHSYLAALKNDTILERLKIECSSLPYKMLPNIANEMLKMSIHALLS
ncbi:DUF2513 domain-containing protein [Shewanella sp. SR41-2]|nr:DUF2513 domain-containing protein [Shewanella sp. SR41-2]